MRMIKHFTYLYDYATRALQDKIAITGDILGARWSGKTMSVMIMCAQLLFINNSVLYEVKRVRINWVRLEVGSANENFEEFLDVLRDLNIYHLAYINRKNRSIKYKNCEMRFIGYESSRNKEVKRLGIKRSSNVDLMINVFEEVFEFARYKDINVIEQAVGQAGSVITLRLANPWDEGHWWLKNVDSKIISINKVWNETKMRKEGYNFFKLNENDFISWTNHWVNEYLSDIAHQKLLQTWKYDPAQARIVELGAMGVVEGGIYTRALLKVKNIIPDTYKPFEFYIGVDVGLTKDATCFYLMSNNKDCSEFAIHNEYYHSNRDQEFFVNGKKLPFLPKEVPEYTHDLLNMASMWSTRLSTRLIAHIDFSSAMYQFFNESAKMKGFSPRLMALPCKKVPISIRVDMTLMLMNRGAFHINKANCPKLMEELKGARYPDKSEEKFRYKKNGYDIIRLDGKDHSINAIEYGIGTKFYRVRDLPLARLYLRKLWSQHGRH